MTENHTQGAEHGWGKPSHYYIRPRGWYLIQPLRGLVVAGLAPAMQKNEPHPTSGVLPQTGGSGPHGRGLGDRVPQTASARVLLRVDFLSTETTETTETMETNVPNGDKCRCTRAPRD